MSKQYWIGEFFVDLSRNQISQHYQSQTLPPKALLVLTHLAENHGKVVSYDELLDKVWLNAVVTPNTLQRSIAQLRKALGENSKVEGIIKTHAKQGYSLECDVTWSDDGQLSATGISDSSVKGPLGDEQQTGTDNYPKEDTLPDANGHNLPHSEQSVGPVEKTSKKTFWVATVVVVLVLVFSLSQFQINTAPLKFSDLRYLTATDDKEYGGTYSPDGNYILFSRYYDKVCINNIWAKNADTLQEILLTKERGTYGSHSLSANSKTLVFIKQEDCTKPVTQNICYKLMSLDFEQALLQPQTARELLHCQNSAIKKPVWIDDQHIALLQKEEQHWRLIRFSTEDKSSSTLYEIEGGNIVGFAYSAEHQLLAVTSRKNDGLQYIEMLSLQGELISSHQIRLPEGTRRYLSVQPNFVPNTEKLIFGDGTDLYTLSFDGEVYRENFQLNKSAGGPFVHPQGDRILLIAGRYDSDVARLSIPEAELNEQQNNKAKPSVFERSITHEDNAKFQPNGSLIAFVSMRTGNEQVWLFEDSGSKVISQFPRGNHIRNLHWSSDGNSLIVLANKELHQVFLDSAPIHFDFPYPVNDLFHWDSEKQLAVANILVNGVNKFVEIDLHSQQYKIINNKRVNWAAKSQNGPLVFIDHMERFWQKQNGAIEDKLIEPLAGQGSSKRFVVGNELVYGINKQNQLWSYDLQSNEFKLLADVPKDIDYLNDVHDKELLMSVVIAAKKEVIEISVTD